MTNVVSDSTADRSSATLELLKLKLERARYRSDILKWIVVAIGAIVSFAVVDYGKLELERLRVSADNQRQLLEAYLRATESPEPDVWKRKLHVLLNFADDEQIRRWAKLELRYIQDFAGLDALYRETLKVASQLVEPGRINDPERVRARVRFNQLYWADLPYARESPQVAEAMVAFRAQLVAAEAAPDRAEQWDALNQKLIELSKVLRESTPLPTGAP